MNSEDMALIAEAHSWYLNKTKYYSLESSRVPVAYDYPDHEWHLTDSGCFRVLVESPGKAAFEKRGLSWECWFMLPDKGFSGGAQSPHEAVALARLAQLRCVSTKVGF